MAMVIDVPKALREIGQIVAKIRELNEWAKLEKEEARPSMPTSFRIQTDTDENLHFQLGLFAAKDLELRALLSRGSMPAAEAANWQRQLHAVEGQVSGLGFGERFIRP